jgi:hypothetical protein
MDLRRIVALTERSAHRIEARSTFHRGLADGLDTRPRRLLESGPMFDHLSTAANSRAMAMGMRTMRAWSGRASPT